MVYVSGRIDVNDVERYRSQFMQAKQYLEKEVYVYADKDIITWFDVLESVLKEKSADDFLMSEELEMRIDLARRCDRLYLLQGWQQEDMCKVEHTVAKSYNHGITYSKKF